MRITLDQRGIHQEEELPARVVRVVEDDRVLLDEPTRGIDVGAKSEIYQLVGQLAKNGTAFLVVSSEMPELLAVCDRIYVLCDGRLTGEFTRGSFDQEAIMEAATRFIEKVNNGNRIEERQL